MKSICDALRQPVIQHIKKDITPKSLEVVGSLTSKIGKREIEDKIDINQQLKLVEDKQTPCYKPTTPWFNNSNFGIRRGGLNDVFYRQFSTNKGDRMPTKFADPTNDVAFKKVFSEDNIKGVQDFVESVISNAKDFPFSTKFKTVEFLNKDHMQVSFRVKKVCVI